MVIDSRRGDRMMMMMWGFEWGRDTIGVGEQGGGNLEFQLCDCLGRNWIDTIIKEAINLLPQP